MVAPGALRDLLLPSHDHFVVDVSRQNPFWQRRPNLPRRTPIRQATQRDCDPNACNSLNVGRSPDARCW